MFRVSIFVSVLVATSLCFFFFFAIFYGIGLLLVSYSDEVAYCFFFFCVWCCCVSQIDENVKREIINHRSLRHPNIVRFKEVSYIFLGFYLKNGLRPSFWSQRQGFWSVHDRNCQRFCSVHDCICCRFG